MWQADQRRVSCTTVGPRQEEDRRHYYFSLDGDTSPHENLRNESPIWSVTSRPGTEGAGRTSPNSESERTGSGTLSRSAIRNSPRTTCHGTTTVLGELSAPTAMLIIISLNEVGDGDARPSGVDGTSSTFTSAFMAVRKSSLWSVNCCAPRNKGMTGRRANFVRASAMPPGSPP